MIQAMSGWRVCIRFVLRRAAPVCAVALVAAGCTDGTSGHLRFYRRLIPAPPAPDVGQVWTFYYGTRYSADDLIATLFKDYQLVGVSRWNGPFDSPLRSDVRQLARQQGASIVVATVGYTDTRTGVTQLSFPSTTQSYTTGTVGGKRFTSQTTSTGTQTMSQAYQVHRYDHDTLFLRDRNNVGPFWDQACMAMGELDPSPFNGRWQTDGYVIRVSVVAGTLYGCVDQSGRPGWEPHDLKFFHMQGQPFGVYMWGDRTPFPVTYEIDQFGSLVVRRIGIDDPVIFRRSD